MPTKSRPGVRKPEPSKASDMAVSANRLPAAVRYFSLDAFAARDDISFMYGEASIMT